MSPSEQSIHGIMPISAPPPRPLTALAMFSGGLDSLIAVCWMRALNIRVEAVTFDSPFFDSQRACQSASHIDVPLHILDFGPELTSIVRNPHHGFGANMNPCIDCHIAMLHRTGEFMDSKGYDFIITGEVLNQRPMSQNMSALKLIARESGYESKILRPLSATLLDPTEPEKLGWVDRARLGRIEGRSRREQMRLAHSFGITDIPPVAGGCRLTEPNFARRLKDLRDHDGLGSRRAIQLLRIGRHLRLNANTKLIVGRNERDNLELEGGAELYDLLLKPEGIPGPTGLAPITIREADLRFAAAICARYSDAAPDRLVPIRIRTSRGIQHIETFPAPNDTVTPLLV